MITVIVQACGVVYGDLRHYMVGIGIIGIYWMYGRNRAVRACMMWRV